MDISDLTSNESPRELKFEKEYIPEYCREALRGLKSCVAIIEKAVKDNGLTMGRFHELRVKNVNDLIKDELNQMRSIRESIENPTDDTILQRVITNSEFEEYLNGKLAVSGFVCRAQDTKDLNTYTDYYESLRLDYKLIDGSYNFLPESKSLYVIRFKTDDIEFIDKPYSKCMTGDRDFTMPCTGNGFTAALNKAIIPEYKIKTNKKASIQVGAEIYEITRDGEEILRAKYTKDAKKFVII